MSKEKREFFVSERPVKQKSSGWPIVGAIIIIALAIAFLYFVYPNT